MKKRAQENELQHEPLENFNLQFKVCVVVKDNQTPISVIES